MYIDMNMLAYSIYTHVYIYIYIWTYENILVYKDMHTCHMPISLPTNLLTQLHTLFNTFVRTYMQTEYLMSSHGNISARYQPADLIDSMICHCGWWIWEAHLRKSDNVLCMVSIIIPRSGGKNGIDTPSYKRDNLAEGTCPDCEPLFQVGMARSGSKFRVCPELGIAQRLFLGGNWW